MNVTHASFAGLDLLASAVLLIDEGQAIRYINPAGENLLASAVARSSASLCGVPAPVRPPCRRRSTTGSTTTGAIPARTSN
jgi:two-component system nitrogen regulation sensor histidine kinase GlnL